jgi:hypothetical protein
MTVPKALLLRRKKFEKKLRFSAGKLRQMLLLVDKIE